MSQLRDLRDFGDQMREHGGFGSDKADERDNVLDEGAKIFLEEENRMLRRAKDANDQEVKFLREQVAQLQGQAQQFAREKEAAEAQTKVAEARANNAGAHSRKNSVDSSAASVGDGMGGFDASKPGTPNSLSNTSAFAHQNTAGGPPPTNAQSNAILQLKNANKFLTAQKDKFKGESEKAAAEYRRSCEEGVQLRTEVARLEQELDEMRENAKVVNEMSFDRGLSSNKAGEVGPRGMVLRDGVHASADPNEFS